MGFTAIAQDRDPESAVFYGPKLPLFENGTYAFELDARAPDAERGTVVGRMNVRQREGQDDGWVTVAAGRPAVARFVQTNNLPVHLVFVFDRTADVEIRRVVLRREE